jgi:maltodextrin utilization protein YvdJ
MNELTDLFKPKTDTFQFLLSRKEKCGFLKLSTFDRCLNFNILNDKNAFNKWMRLTLTWNFLIACFVLFLSNYFSNQHSFQIRLILLVWQQTLNKDWTINWIEKGSRKTKGQIDKQCTQNIKERKKDEQLW